MSAQEQLNQLSQKFSELQQAIKITSEMIN